jgi:hypothetical protein
MPNAIVQDLVNRICSFWQDRCEGTAESRYVEGKGWDISLKSVGDDWYVGNYADPGLFVHDDLQTVTVGGETFNVVRVNSVVLPALASHIVGWAQGYDP